jgi:hypothetical protein
MVNTWNAIWRERERILARMESHLKKASIILPTNHQQLAVIHCMHSKSFSNPTPRKIDE